MKKFVFFLCAAVTSLSFESISTVFAATVTEVPNTLLSEVSGEVVKEGKTDRVLLYGKHSNKGFYTDGIFIEVRDGDTGGLIASLSPHVNAGYKPAILLGKFTENHLEQIFLGIDSGGSGGYQYSYVFSVADQKAQTIWNFEQWNKSYSAQFEDGYRLTVKELDSGLSWVSDISGRNQTYLSQIYQTDGTLIQPLSGDVSGVNAVFPFYNPSSERFGLLIAQSVTGLYRADGYGYVQHLTRWENSAFRSYFTTFNSNGTLVTS